MDRGVGHTSHRKTNGRQGVVVCAFLDIEEAFDFPLNCFPIKDKREHHNFQMDKRNAGHKQVGARTISLKKILGCQQGGVLSVLIWILVVDELLNPKCMNFQANTPMTYSTVIIARGKCEKSLCYILLCCSNL